jgi:hypothetical protein
MGEKKPGVVYKRKCRKVEDRIQPIMMQLPEEFHIIHNIIGDPLENMLVLPMHPTDFIPGLQYMQEWHNKLQFNPDGSLWPEEEKLVYHLVKEQEECLSWSEEEEGEFHQDFFPPVHIHIPTVLHMLCVYKNIPIPLGLHDVLIKIICDKIASAYELSNATNHSRWFCVIKWDRSSIHVVHDLHPFNSITEIPPSCISHNN